MTPWPGLRFPVDLPENWFNLPVTQLAEKGGEIYHEHHKDRSSHRSRSGDSHPRRMLPQALLPAASSLQEQVSNDF
jgi:hypothetical protein